MYQIKDKSYKNIFFTSDLHLSHVNLIKSLTTWTDQAPCRDFTSVEQMNNTLIDGINDKVDVNDILYILGDFALCKLELWWIDLIVKINCKNVHLIVGNHDPKKDLLLNKVIKNTNLKPLDLFKTIASVSEVEVITNETEKQLFFLSHYSHRVWNKSHHGSIHLYGHSHGSLEHSPWGRSMDCGVDNYYKLFGTYKPFSIDEVKFLLQDRKPVILDHHR